VINEAGQTSRDWGKLSAAVLKKEELNQHEREISYYAYR